MKSRKLLAGFLLAVISLGTGCSSEPTSTQSSAVEDDAGDARAGDSRCPATWYENEDLCGTPCNLDGLNCFYGDDGKLEPAGSTSGDDAFLCQPPLESDAGAALVWACGV